MKRWVSLSTDCVPWKGKTGSAYAIYAPLVTRFWQRLGYTPILFMHDTGWDTAFGAHVLANLPPDIMRVSMPRLEPLSIGNTMRTVRLAACAHEAVAPEDLIITADIDMAPISRDFFNQPSNIFVLRADMYGPMEGASQLLENDGTALLCGLFRFPLCYVGLTTAAWRDITPYPQDGSCHGNPVALARRILHGLRYDAVDYDESYCSARLLLSRYAVGSLQKHEDGSWTQGELRLVPQTDWPKGWPKNMILGGQGQVVSGGDESVVDWHMAKPASPGMEKALTRFWPEERDFLIEYWRKACELAGFSG